MSGASAASGARGTREQILEMTGDHEMEILDASRERARDSEDRWVRSLRYLPWIAASMFTFVGIRYLYRAHPSEDAFILFKYVENFVQGFGIVYYPGGPHAEGATDFLWFLILSALRFAGIDVAVAACLVGAAGAWVASYLCCELVRRSSLTGKVAFVFGLASLGVVYVNSTLGGYLGFSSMFYAASFLALACVVLWAERAILWVPLLALAVALIRPDGVVPCVLFAVLGFVRARELHFGRRYAAWSSVVLGLGAAYYAWRLDYFGLLLPLPLYVKSRQTPTLTPWRLIVSTVRVPYGWIMNDPPLETMSLGVLVLLALSAARRWRDMIRSAITFTPFLVHSVMMGYATQMQNVVGRFQAPERLALYFALLWCGVRAWQSADRALFRAIALVACLGPMAHEVYVGKRTLRTYESARLYVDDFAPEFGRLMGPGRVIALTEAGRLCYWTKARVEDTIGLNTPRTALAPPDLEYFEELSPDVLMFHAGLTNLKNALKDRTEPVVQISSELLGQSLKPEHMSIYRDGITEYDRKVPDTVAVILMARYLEASQKYDVYVVRYGTSYNHVYAIKKGLPEEARLVELLKEAASGTSPYRSYAEVQHFWGTAAAGSSQR
jgi:hypothetical protein